MATKNATTATSNKVASMMNPKTNDDDTTTTTTTNYDYCCEVEDMGYNLLMEAKEYRFTNDPTTLRQVIELCDNKYHQLDEFDCDDEVLFWLAGGTNNNNACFGRRSTNFSSNAYLISEGYYCISLVLQTSIKRYPLEIYGQTSDDAVDCLIYLLQLPDNDDNGSSSSNNNNNTFMVDKVTVIPKGIGNYNFNPMACPISPTNLQKILIAAQRRQYKFQRTIFTAEQAYVMATTGNKTNLWFRLCQFEDDGASFVDAFDHNQNQSVNNIGPHDDDDIQLEGSTTTTTTIGPSKLTFDGYPRQPPFVKIHWLRFFKLVNIDLCLRYVCFDRDCSKALANGNVKGLSLVDCTFADEGEALVESIRQRCCTNINTTTTSTCQQGSNKEVGQKQSHHHHNQQSKSTTTTTRRRGPRSLEIEADTFQRLDIWEQFMIEIGHPNCSLESLGISNGSRSTNIVDANGEIYDHQMFTMRFMTILSKALITNTNLKELSCHIPPHSSHKESIHKLCTAIGNHPNLIKIDIRPDIINNVVAFGGGDAAGGANTTTIHEIYRQRIEYTNLIVKVVENNPNLEYVQYYEEVFDSTIWQTTIVPRLIHNRYNKLFTKYRSYHLIDPTLAIALENVAKKKQTNKQIGPSLVWMLLSDHCEKMVL